MMTRRGLTTFVISYVKALTMYMTMDADGLVLICFCGVVFAFLYPHWASTLFLVIVIGLTSIIVAPLWNPPLCRDMASCGVAT